MTSISDHELHALARKVLQAACDREGYLVTAESCTGGYLASLLTGVEGLSHGFDRAFVAYSDEAKTEVLDIAPEVIERAGAVSEDIGRLMARRALEKSRALCSVGITGYTGGAPPGEENGLVHLAVMLRSGHAAHRECHFGDVNRDEGRRQACLAALELISETMSKSD